MTEDTLVFFANWQSQACRLLFESSRSAVVKQDVAKYLYRMHDQIIRQGVYESVRRHPARHVSVEVACALEGLNEAYALARASNDPRAERYRACICAGLAYLLRLQRTRNGTERERGGFGMSIDDRAQRIDVTGFVAESGWRWVGLHYTNIKYKNDFIRSVDASHVGVRLTFRF